MRSIRIVGLCLAVVFAISSIAVASASAEGPHYQVCAKAAKVGKKYTGQFTNKTCVTKSLTEEGKYTLKAWNPNIITLNSRSGRTVFFSGHLLFISGYYGWVECASDTDIGTFNLSEVGKSFWTFYGCKPIWHNNSNPNQCSSPGRKAGEIKTTELDSELVYLDKAHSKIGLLIRPATGEVIDEFACGPASFRTVGAVLSEVSGDVNEASKVQTETLAVGAENLQLYSQIEEEGPAIGMVMEPNEVAAKEMEMEPGPAPASETSVDVVKMKTKEELYLAAF